MGPGQTEVLSASPTELWCRRRSQKLQKLERRFLLYLLRKITKFSLQRKDKAANTTLDWTLSYRADYHNQAAMPLRPNYPGKVNLNVELVSHPNCALVSVDEPAVAAAGAKHLATAPEQTSLVQHREHSEDIVGQGYPQERPSLVKHPNSAIVPVESQDVIDARAAHLAHHQNV